jgi:predicted transposase YbfD/YdcC
MNILEELHQLPDPRMAGKVKHKLGTVCFVALCAVLSGCESWGDIEEYCEIKREWLSQYVDLFHGIPSEWTFRRVFTLLHPDYMAEFLQRHAAHLVGNKERDSHQIAIDGKALRGSKRQDLQCLQSVSAWCHEHSVVLGECQVDGKSNEITAIPLLLNTLDIYQKTITIDAMGCQKNICELIRSKKGHYVVGLKQNQKHLYQEALALKNKEGEHKANRLHDTFDDGHGRSVRRRYFGYDARKLSSIEAWAGAKSIIAVETITSKHNAPNYKTSACWRYYFSSHKHNDRKLPDYIRNHWSVENRLHWMLDVHLKEDDDQKAERKSARSFALLRRISLNILRLKGETVKKRSLRRRRKRAGWSNEYLLSLLVD